MTICVAAIYHNKTGPVVAVASDKEVTCGGSRLLGIKNDKKIVEFPGFAVLMSGGGVLYEALLMLQEDKRYCSKVRVESHKEARSFASDVFAQCNIIKEGLVNTADGADSVGALLIATPTQLFQAFNDNSVFEIGTFSVTGSGGAVATGALMYGYRRLTGELTKEQLGAFLKEIVEITSESELGCGQGVDIIYPTEAPTVKRQPKKVVKTKTPQAKSKTKVPSRRTNKVKPKKRR